MKYVVMIVAGGLAYWAIEKYAIKDDKLFGAFAYEQDSTGAPKLTSPGYIATGAAVVLGAAAAGAILHKVSKRIPRGVTVTA